MLYYENELKYQKVLIVKEWITYVESIKNIEWNPVGRKYYTNWMKIMNIKSISSKEWISYVDSIMSREWIIEYKSSKKKRMKGKTNDWIGDFRQVVKGH